MSETDKTSKDDGTNPVNKFTAGLTSKMQALGTQKMSAIDPDKKPTNPKTEAVEALPTQRMQAVGGTPKPKREKGPDIFPRLSVRITPDNLKAFLILDTLGLDFSQATATNIYTYLNSTKLDTDLVQYNKINEMVAIIKKIQSGEAQEPIIEVQVCQGSAMVPGIDGWVKFYFPHNQRVVITDDDKADFRNLERYVTIKQNDKIATLFLGVVGKPGKDVYGAPINPSPIKRPKVVIGSNINTEQIVSPEEPEKVYIEYSAATNGVLYSSDESINVSEQLTIRGNVGLSTGNINYNGAITVEGSIEEGSKVTCTESLLIAENLESSDIEVGGDLIVKAGIKLKQSKTIKIKGNVKAKFIENAVIEVDGDVIVEGFILNSKIFCLGSLVVTGATGAILGSEIIIYGGLSTTNLGNNSGNDVTIDLGYHYRNEKLYNDLGQAIKTSEKEIEQLVPQVQRMNNFIKQSRGKIDEDKKAKFKELFETYQKKNIIHKKLLLKQEELKTTRFNPDKIHLMVKGAAFPGTTIKYRRQIEKIQVMQTAFMMAFFPGQENNAPMTAISSVSKKK
ncbi:MAG: FapA family protein [Leptospiraceae bacterium]|nr:FapA family protein [Leptospiraceae bacterium]